MYNLNYSILSRTHPGTRAGGGSSGSDNGGDNNHGFPIYDAKFTAVSREKEKAFCFEKSHMQRIMQALYIPCLN